MTFKDRVKQYTNTIGTADYSLSGSFSSYETFADSFSDGDKTSVGVTDGSDYEIVHVTVGSSGIVLSRDNVISSSNSGNKVVWSAGNKTIFCTLSAALVMTYGTGDPSATRNPEFIGAQYVDTSSGTMWFCLDDTTDANVWTAVGGISSSEAENIALALVIALG